MTLDNLVKVTIFLSDRQIHRRLPPRARRGAGRAGTIGLTTIITGIFDEKWLLEIEAIAAA